MKNQWAPTEKNAVFVEHAVFGSVKPENLNILNFIKRNKKNKVKTNSEVERNYLRSKFKIL